MRALMVVLVALLAAGCESQADQAARAAQLKAQQDAAIAADVQRMNTIAMGDCQDRGYHAQSQEFEICRKAALTRLVNSRVQELQQGQAQMMAPYLAPLAPAPQPRQVQTYCYQSGTAVLCNSQ